MADKLEPQKVLEAIENCGIYDQQVVLEYAYNMIRQMIDNYVPAIRCKDCKYAEHITEYLINENLYYCVWHDEIHNTNWYCPDGKREECDSDAVN